jgi:hypothetical protein
VIRWLHVKRVYNTFWDRRTPELSRKANVQLAIVGAFLCLAENIPQIVVTVMYLDVRSRIPEQDPRIKAWTPAAQLNIVLSGMSAIWKIAAPILTWTGLV